MLQQQQLLLRGRGGTTKLIRRRIQPAAGRACLHQERATVVAAHCIQLARLYSPSPKLKPVRSQHDRTPGNCYYEGKKVR